MTLGAHCLRCGKAHCDVHERDAMLWPPLPIGNKKLRKSVCGCSSLANPRCSCPKKSCAPPVDLAKKKKKSNCDCPKKKKKCKNSKRRRSNVAVIHVKVVFIGSFLFYCLLLNHSF